MKALLLTGVVCLALSTGPWAGAPAQTIQPGRETRSTTSTQHGVENWELLAPMVVERLDNGMTFLLYPNRRAPIFSGVIRFNVGGKDERPGMTGIAHMFEHMAFKGTRHLGTRDWVAEQGALKKVEELAYATDDARNRAIQLKLSPKQNVVQRMPLEEAFNQARQAAEQYVVKNEFDEIYSRAGANDMNAQTASDATTYFVSLPANQIELWVRMESERLSQPVMREFYNERDVVMEERRMRNDSSPFGRLWELLLASAYTANSYGYPVIGFESDIRNLKATEAYEFFRTHYTPDRAIGVLVGDIDVAKTRALLRQYFGPIPARGKEQIDQHVIPEPPQMGERRVSLSLSASPLLLLAWHKPNLPDPADVRAELLQQAVAGGRSARWFEKLVKRERLAAEISAFTDPGEAQPNLFVIYATPQGATTLDRLETAVRGEVARLREEPLGAEELQRAKKNLRADTVRTLQTNLGLAEHLAESAQISGDPYYLERRLRQIEALTAADALAFAKQYLIDDNLTVARLAAPPAAAPEQGVKATGDKPAAKSGTKTPKAKNGTRRGKTE